jgi:hypothetical protein
VRIDAACDIAAAAAVISNGHRASGGAAHETSSTRRKKFRHGADPRRPNQTFWALQRSRNALAKMSFCPPVCRSAAAGRWFGGGGDAEIGRFAPERCRCEPFRCEAALEQLTHGRSPAGHTSLETEVVKRRQFLGIQHDLKTFRSRSLGHRSAPKTLYPPCHIS